LHYIVLNKNTLLTGTSALGETKKERKQHDEHANNCKNCTGHPRREYLGATLKKKAAIHKP
jgi:hypothetical protein